MQDLETISLPHPLEEFSSIIDVRTPLEFEEDHLPGAINLPVLTNEQRVEVGTLYKENPFAGRVLGARYISLNSADHLLTLEKIWDSKHHPLLYCWRGGLRSRSFTHILRSIGWRARVLEGGYKSYRKFVLQDLTKRLSDPLPHFHVLAGFTGTGKTRLLHHLQQSGAQVLDLEALANHRGSLLGNVGPQPSQKLFESSIHQAMQAFDPERTVFVEAESNRIGARSLPAPLWKKLATATVTEVCLPLPSRAQLLLDDYPRFLNEPDDLCQLLDKLRSLRGHKQVDQWHQLIAAQDWPAFLQSILRDHYDLCYRPVGNEGSNYQSPQKTLEIADHSDHSFQEATQTLLSL
ncbi:MAG: tRNA 2-selenouridine(34) synthase MnmH [Roseibacillus sp.]